VSTRPYRFLLSDTGEKQLHFETEDSGIASWELFENPDPGDAGVFTSTLQE
jgi:hypothetical protein